MALNRAVLHENSFDSGVYMANEWTFVESTKYGSVYYGTDDLYMQYLLGQGGVLVPNTGAPSVYLRIGGYAEYGDAPTDSISIPVKEVAGVAITVAFDGPVSEYSDAYVVIGQKDAWRGSFPSPFFIGEGVFRFEISDWYARTYRNDDLIHEFNILDAYEISPTHISKWDLFRLAVKTQRIVYFAIEVIEIQTPFWTMLSATREE